MRSEDLAKLIGVSRSTITRVINNYPDIPQATRDKVLKAIEEYNYAPNASARKLAGATNKMIAIIVLDVKDDGVTHHVKTTDDTLIYNNPFFSPVINAVSDQANKMDYYALISIAYSKEDLKKVESIFNQKMIEGAIFVGTQEAENELIFKLIKQNHKIALIDTNEIYSKKHDAIYINPDNFEGSVKAINYLVELGHKNIGIITGNLNKLSAQERLDGFKETLSRHGLVLNCDHFYHGDFTENSGYDGVNHILRAHSKPTAIFVSNDTMAIGAYKAIAEIGLKIPEDISIIGFDNSFISSYLTPPLTTVDISFADIAKRATTLLIDSVENNKKVGIVEKIHATLIERESCKRIN
ncbi:LacI family DNA-binding transcriptional regulator [Evansella cellulosilytica]|uniref:Transcriptional regulator, LacI family n=1 Tax=Evansella cellulosilytica (strain ATCC 21833 / DSM 2522 / FERM P-1141 / JCM 9156 / N-4) TaxID=649639 RepID=E6TXJ3_EVAC2|nr:LacI family DNA-binding transcriptional regulator [Evansella cellulosilytica]ADU28807.1 transcriptional regulator, LacI family [Evansella cellulosilytica DSM 2522]